LPRRENVLFFDDIDQARAAGFRPCKRCQPDAGPSRSEQASAVIAACRLIDQADQPLSLEQLASAVDYSPSHFHRLFKQTVGVTPKAYMAMRRANRVRANLLNSANIAHTVYASGYATSSRFYEESDEVLGMKPSEYRTRAKDILIRVAVALTPLGAILIAATDKGLCAIEFADNEQDLLEQFREKFPEAQLDESAQLKAWVDQIVAHLDAPHRELSLPLDIQGTAFQCRVWDELRKLPAGSTTTYSELAQRIGQPKAARAVAGACAANQLAVVIPCHRVIRSDGRLGGYRWGIERKKALLAKERS
jgi:AraC family transcriptional regulator of adaptative response/methylated-DNA-[protein]-cysteine methyltransferase